MLSAVNRVLRYDEARAFYDRFGRRQDRQRWYEDAALAVLRREIPWSRVRRVVEWGCGTGRFAAELLRDHLPADAVWTGFDLSDTMRQLCQQRLQPWSGRVRVLSSEGLPRLTVEDGSQDAVVSTYVLDLMAETDIHAFFTEAARVTRPEGWLGVCSLYRATDGWAGVVTRLWTAVHRRRPAAVGGCRPLQLRSLLPEEHWQVESHRVVRPFGLASEVLVARRRAVRR